MDLRHTLLAAAIALTASGAAHADALRPIESRSIDLGAISGDAYYTVEPDGFRLVATLAQGDTARPSASRHCSSPARASCCRARTRSASPPTRSRSSGATISCS